MVTEGLCYTAGANVGSLLGLPAHVVGLAAYVVLYPLIFLLSSARVATEVATGTVSFSYSVLTFPFRLLSEVWAFITGGLYWVASNLLHFIPRLLYNYVLSPFVWAISACTHALSAFVSASIHKIFAFLISALGRMTAKLALILSLLGIALFVTHCITVFVFGRRLDVKRIPLSVMVACTAVLCVLCLDEFEHGLQHALEITSSTFFCPWGFVTGVANGFAADTKYLQCAFSLSFCK